MRIAVTGAGGRLGAATCVELAGAGHEVTALLRADLDITNKVQVRSVLAPLRAEVIVNCSAYNAVDEAEGAPDAAFSLNADGPAALAAFAGSSGSTLVHYSSDFVFDGTSAVPYVEDHPPNPLSVYGESKLAGEHAVRKAARHYILRVASLFGGTATGTQRATVDWIADRLLACQTVHAAVDRTVSPSYVPDVTRATRALLEGARPFGTYHCVNTGFTTWFDLAREVASAVGVSGRLEMVTAAGLRARAVRPRLCALSNRKLYSVGIVMPEWQSAVRRHLDGKAGVAPLHARATA